MLGRKPARRTSLALFVDKKEREIESAISEIDLESVSDSDIDTLAKRLAPDFYLVTPKIDESDAHVSHTEDCQVDVRKDPNRHVSDRSKPCMVAGKKIVISVSLIGDGGLLTQLPTSPNAVSGDLTIEHDHLDLTYVRPFPIDDPLLDRDIKNDLRAISANMGFVTSDIDLFNRELPSVIAKKLRRQLAALEASKHSFEGLSFPKRIKSQEPNDKTQIAPMRARGSGLPVLEMHRPEAYEKLEEQIARGLSIRSRDFSSKSDINQAFDDTERWTKYTHALICKMFDSDVVADEFSDWIKTGYDSDIGIAHVDSSLQQSTKFFLDNIDPKINRLKSIREKLDLYPSSIAPVSTQVFDKSKISQSARYRYDLFICYASEDKSSVVEKLAQILIKQGVRVWYDALTLRIGDSLREKIDQGLTESRFGLVILSNAFFNKQWTKRELDGLTEKEMRAGKKVILPIWHGVTHEEVLRFSPPLAGKVAGSTNDLQKLVDGILEVLREDD